MKNINNRQKPNVVPKRVFQNPRITKSQKDEVLQRHQKHDQPILPKKDK